MDRGTGVLLGSLVARDDLGQGDADAGGERDLLVGRPERLRRDHAGQPLGDLDDLLGAPGALDQDGKLVAAPARYRVMDRHDGPQSPGRLGEHQVARAVPHRVVDRSEPVKVKEDDASPPGGGRPLAAPASTSLVRSSMYARLGSPVSPSWKVRCVTCWRSATWSLTSRAVTSICPGSPGAW